MYSIKKCKITTYILFKTIFLKTILNKLFSQVQLNTPQYERRKDLVFFIRKYAGHI